MKSKFYFSIFLLLFFSSVAWQQTNSKTSINDVTCTRDCTGRTVSECFQTGCVLIEKFTNCSFPVTCSGNLEVRVKTACRGDCHSGVLTTSGVCSTNHNCQLTRVTKCDVTKACTSSWSSWSDVTKCQSDCQGNKFQVRRCLSPNNQLSKLCPGKSLKGIEKKEKKCEEDCTRSEKICSNICSSKIPTSKIKSLLIQQTSSTACDSSTRNFTIACDVTGAELIEHPEDLCLEETSSTNWLPIVTSQLMTSSQFKVVSCRVSNKCQRSVVMETKCNEKKQVNDGVILLVVVCMTSLVVIAIIVLITIVVSRRRPKRVATDDVITCQPTTNTLRRHHITVVVTDEEGNQSQIIAANDQLTSRGRFPTPMKNKDQPTSTRSSLEYVAPMTYFPYDKVSDDVTVKWKRDLITSSADFKTNPTTSAIGGYIEMNSQRTVKMTSSSSDYIRSDRHHGNDDNDAIYTFPLDEEMENMQ